MLKDVTERHGNLQMQAAAGGITDNTCFCNISLMLMRLSLAPSKQL